MLRDPNQPIKFYASLENSSGKNDELLKISHDIPKDSQKFYESFGFFENNQNRQPVEKLTTYQKDIWNETRRYKYQMVIKSQKVGFTTSSLLQDFQYAILPTHDPMSCMGREILVIAQKLDMARQHIYTLRKMVLQSKLYSRFLIGKPTELLLKDEVTKMTVMFIHNPENPFKPTRIIGLGPREGGVWSWKEVGRIHMSDIAASNQKDDTGLFGAAFSRLANTGGTFLIETPPRGQRGTVWDIWKRQKLTPNKNDTDAQKAAQFKIDTISYREGIQSGLFTDEFIEAERERLGPLFAQYYECSFINPYSTWYDRDLIQYDDELSSVVEL